MEIFPESHFRMRTDIESDQFGKKMRTLLVGGIRANHMLSPCLFSDATWNTSGRWYQGKAYVITMPLLGCYLEHFWQVVSGQSICYWHPSSQVLPRFRINCNPQVMEQKFCIVSKSLYNLSTREAGKGIQMCPRKYLGKMSNVQQIAVLALAVQSIVTYPEPFYPENSQAGCKILGPECTLLLQ